MKKPIQIEIAGRPLRCGHCEAAVFFEHREPVQRAAGLLFESWTSTKVYVCSRCGLHHRFSHTEKPESQAVPEADERVVCLSCGEEVPSDAASCPKCGWSWDEADTDQST